MDDFFSICFERIISIITLNTITIRATPTKIYKKYFSARKFLPKIKSTTPIKSGNKNDILAKLPTGISTSTLFPTFAPISFLHFINFSRSELTCGLLAQQGAGFFSL